MNIIDFTKKSNSQFLHQLNNIDSPFLLSQEEKRILHQKLKKTNFVLNSTNYNLVYYNEQFLISSLLNDYKKTITILNKIDASKVTFDPENFDALTQILIHNDFVCNNDTPELFLEAPYAFVASSYFDPIKTLANFKYTSSFSNEEKTYIYEKGLKENYIPIAFLNEPFISDKFILKKYIANDEEINFIINNLLNPNIEYSYEDEKKLLSFLNSSCENIEDELKLMHQKNTYRYDMSITQVLAFAFYARKYLFENQTKNYRINMFNYCNNDTVKGLHTNDDIFVFVEQTPSLATVKNMLLSLNHELTHAIQQNHFIKVDFQADEDVDLYTKDYFFNMTFGKEYSLSNYHSLSYEIDADIKANIITSLILGENIFNQNENNLNTNEIINELKNMKFIDTGVREYKGNTYTIDELMNIAINKFSECHEKGRFVISKIFTTIGYEYDLKSIEIKKRTLKELIDNLDLETNQKIKDIYTRIIARTISCDDKNMEILLNSLKENYRNETKVILSKVAYNQYSNQANSSLKYIKFTLEALNNKHHK